MKTCTTCSRQFPDEFEFCLTDGTNLFKNIEQVVPLSAVTQTWKFCGKCAEPVSAEYLFCKKCGTPRGDSKPVELPVTESYIASTFGEKEKIVIGSILGIVIFGGAIFWLSASSNSSSQTNNYANVNKSNTNANNKIRVNPQFTLPGNTSNTNYSTPNNYGSTTNKKTGRLTTDSNIRDESNKDAISLGIHFKGAKVEVLDETSYYRDDGEYVIWYRVKVMEYGCSVDQNLGCGKNSNYDSDEGWINAKNILLD